MVRLLILICLFINVGIALGQSADRAAQITTHDGKEYSGVVLSEDSTQLVIIDKGAKVTVLKSQIANVVFYQSVMAMKKSKPTFGAFGISFLQPCMINTVGEIESKTFGGRLSLGYLGSTYGIQGNFLYNLGRGSSYNHHVSLGVGYSHQSQGGVDYYGYPTVSEWTYLGGFYDMNYHGVFVETGLTVGSGSFSNPQISLQFGLVYEFR